MTTQQGPTLGRCLLYCAPINGLPPDGGSNRQEICLFRFSNVNFPILGSPLWVKFPLLGWTWIGAHRTLLQHSASQEGNSTWWQMVPTNFVHFPKWWRYILARYLAWLAIFLTLFTVTPEKDGGRVAERLKRWTCNLYSPLQLVKSRPDRLLDLFSVVPSWDPRPRL